MQLIAKGLSNKEVGTHIGITEGTVKVYMYKLFQKIRVSSRLELHVWAAANPERAAGGHAPVSLPFWLIDPRAALAFWAH